ncbi:MAG: hypothetical protein A2498_11730 [Lentisphaerae bacterium RIFOXYC12_FULL_60_16]|nr:MAG: hypothetical protein A2498_11730 [Lentisphaerae bacterium RIFOXYC12_FULL_60_16]
MGPIRHSLIILTHNKRAYTQVCLTGLLNTRIRNWELIVVDNGSTDGTREWLESFIPVCRREGIRLQVLHNPPSTGCSTARNQGANRATGSRLAFLDNDVTVRTRDWLEQLDACLDRHPESAAAGPKLVYPYPPHAIQCAGVGISRSGRVQFRGRGDARDTPRWNAECEVQALISACFLFRRDAFESAGGFDPVFNPVEYEDLDLCYRVRSAGRTTWYTPAAELYHFESVTTAGTPTLPNTRLIIRHGLRFKDRWNHCFQSEDGPPDSATHWKKIPPRALDTIAPLPVLDSTGGHP